MLLVDDTTKLQSLVLETLETLKFHFLTEHLHFFGSLLIAVSN
jgi:hypothetical protein